MVELMAPLWGIEEAVRGRSPQERANMRQDRSAPIVAELFTLWDRELPRLSAKSRLAEAIRYATSR